jgi:hypothetical protein
MGNMSYCRFQNTLMDLEDCLENIEGSELPLDEYLDTKRENSGEDYEYEPLSHEEANAARNLIARMAEFLENYEDQLTDIV